MVRMETIALLIRLSSDSRSLKLRETQSLSGTYHTDSIRKDIGLKHKKMNSVAAKMSKGCLT